jgi:hypothetical protein
LTSIARVGVPRDDRTTGDLDLVLGIELLEISERLVGVRVALRVVAEDDDEKGGRSVRNVTS